MFGPANHNKNYSVGLNASMNVNKRLKAGITLDGYYRNYTQPTYNTFWQAMSRTLPILTDTLADGRYGNSWLRTEGRNNWEHPACMPTAPSPPNWCNASWLPCSRNTSCPLISNTASSSARTNTTAC